MRIPAGCKIFHTIDCHTGGEPLRIITDGFPAFRGKTILEKQSECRERYDGFRRSLIFEPRGHADMYACVLTEPERQDSDFGVFFLHNEGYSSMCGHAIIALTKVAVQCQWVTATPPLTTLKIDTPAGQIIAYAEGDTHHISRVFFDNVPSFVVGEYLIPVESLERRIHVTVAFGGAFYAYVDHAAWPIRLEIDNHQELIKLGREIKSATQEQIHVKHPFDDRLSFLYGTVFTGPALQAKNHSRNVCIFADGEVDRSPTGTGVSGRAAIHYFNGALALNESISIESIIGSEFKVTPTAEMKFGDYPAIVPRVEGQAYITGRHEFIIDPEDPLIEGFIFR